MHLFELEAGLLGDVAARHACHLKRICLGRVLLCLDNQPALVVVLIQQLEYGREVYAAFRIARYFGAAIEDIFLYEEEPS